MSNVLKECPHVISEKMHKSPKLKPNHMQAYIGRTTGEWYINILHNYFIQIYPKLTYVCVNEYAHSE